MLSSGEPAGSLSASGGNQAGARTAAGGSPSSKRAAENEQLPCMMPVPSADGCRQVTSAESEGMTYRYYLSGCGK